MYYHLILRFLYFPLLFFNFPIPMFFSHILLFLNLIFLTSFTNLWYFLRRFTSLYFITQFYVSFISFFFNFLFLLFFTYSLFSTSCFLPPLLSYNILSFNTVVPLFPLLFLDFPFLSYVLHYFHPFISLSVLLLTDPQYVFLPFFSDFIFFYLFFFTRIPVFLLQSFFSLTQYIF